MSKLPVTVILVIKEVVTKDDPAVRSPQDNEIHVKNVYTSEFCYKGSKTYLVHQSVSTTRYLGDIQK